MASELKPVLSQYKYNNNNDAKDLSCYVSTDPDDGYSNIQNNADPAWPSISPLKVLHDCFKGLPCIQHPVRNLKHDPDDGTSTFTFKSAAWLWWGAPVLHIPSWIWSIILMMALALLPLKVLHDCVKERLYSISRHGFEAWSGWWHQRPHL